MFRFSLRSLIGLTFLIAVLITCGVHFFASENPVERDIRLYGETPVEEPDRLFAEVERLAKLGEQAQSDSSYGYISGDESKLNRVELSQIAHHFREMYPFISLRSRLAYESTAEKKFATLRKETLERMKLAECLAVSELLSSAWIVTASSAAIY